MKSPKNVLLFGLAIAFVLVSLVQIFRLNREFQENKKLLSAYTKSESEKRKYLSQLDELKNIIKANCSSESPAEIIRQTMEFVHDNSSHPTDGENGKCAIDIPVVVQQLLLVSSGQRNPKPHLSCGSRSFVMRELLGRFGITSRLVQIFSDAYDHVRGHRLLEIFNRDKKEWEVWDPDYRVTYIDRYKKMPVDITALVFGDIERIVPKNGFVTGWTETGTEVLRENYFKAFSLERFDRGIIEGTMNTTIIVNRERFKFNKVFSDGLTFEQWAIRHYQYPRFLVFPCKWGT